MHRNPNIKLYLHIWHEKSHVCLGIFSFQQTVIDAFQVWKQEQNMEVSNSQTLCLSALPYDCYHIYS